MRPNFAFSIQRNLKFAVSLAVFGLGWLLVSELYGIAGDQQKSNSDGSLVASYNQLLQEPLRADLLIRVAEQNVEKGDLRLARMFFGLAANLNFRDIRAQTPVINDLVSTRQFAKALRLIDITLRAHTGGQQQLFELISAIATERQGFDVLISLLAKKPSWRNNYIRQLALDHDKSELCYKIFSGLRSSPFGPTEEELKLFVEALIGELQIARAHFVWLDFLSSAQLQKVSLLYDGDFTEIFLNQHFDWTYVEIPDVTIGLARRAERQSDLALAINFEQAKLNTTIVSQYLTLEPGLFVFEGQANGARLHGEQVLEWQVRCEEKTTPLAATENVSRVSKWQNFTLKFEIPNSGCSYQKLVLRPRNSNSSKLDGQLYFDNFKLTSVTSDDT